MSKNKSTNPRRFAGASISLLLALSFLALACAPVATPARADTDWGTVAEGAAVGAGSGALIGGLVADGPGTLAGAVVGGVWGAIAGWFAQDKGQSGAESAGDPNAKNVYAKALKNITENYLGQAHADALSDITNYEMESLYYARKAEWAALQLYNEQTAAGTAYTYDPYYVASKGEVANATLAMIWKIASQYEAILNSNMDLANSFIGTYQGMSWGYASSDYSTSVDSTLSVNNPLAIKVGFSFGPTIHGGSYGDSDRWVTLSAGSPLYIINPTGSTIAPRIVITDHAGNVIVDETTSFAAGQVRVYNVPVSGEYSFSQSQGGGMKAFAICSEALSSSATLTPTMVAFTKGTDDSLVAKLFDVKGTYFQDKSNLDMRVDMGFINNDLNAILPKVATMNAQANSFAQAYYNTLVSDGGGDNRVMPDIIFPDPDALADLDPEEIYAIYLLYLRQAQDWFADYSVQDPSSVNISVESLKLKVRGSIYYANGTLAYANTTIFTPYVSLQDMRLTLGRNNMTQPGFAVVWGNATSLAVFDRFTNMVYHPLAVGDYMIIEEMMLDGVPITETDLTVHTVEYYVYDQYNPITPPQNPTDLEYLLAHWYWFAVILGAIFCLAWIPTRNPAIGIIGIILLAVGLGFWLYNDWKNTGGLLLS